MVETIEEICNEKNEYFEQFYLNYKSVHKILAENDDDFDKLFSALSSITGEDPPDNCSVSRNDIPKILRRVVDELTSFLDELTAKERKVMVKREDDYEQVISSSEILVEKYSQD